jgi:hypothetical protein
VTEERSAQLVVVGGTETDGVQPVKQQTALAAEFIFRQDGAEVGITLQNLPEPEIPELCIQMLKDTQHEALDWEYLKMRGIPIEGVSLREIVEHVNARGFHPVSARVGDFILRNPRMLSPDAFILRIEGKDVHNIQDYEIYFLGTTFLNKGVGYRGSVMGIKWSVEAKRWVPVTRSLSGPWNGKQIAFTHADAAQPGWKFETVFNCLLALAVVGAVTTYLFTRAHFGG